MDMLEFMLWLYYMSAIHHFSFKTFLTLTLWKAIKTTAITDTKCYFEGAENEMTSFTNKLNYFVKHTSKQNMYEQKCNFR